MFLPVFELCFTNNFQLKTKLRKLASCNQAKEDDILTPLCLNVISKYKMCYLYPIILKFNVIPAYVTISSEFVANSW